MSDPSDRIDDVFIYKTLLIIDENVALRQVLGEIFVSLGCRVLTAANHGEALPHLRENGVDLVLLGLDFPLHDGRKVFQEIQNKTPVTKLLILSSSGVNDSRELLNGQSGVSFLRKPFTIDELTNQAQTLLHKFPDG